MYKHKDIDYKPQHPHLENYTTCNACLTGKDESFEHSAACKNTKKGGLFGFGGKLDPNSPTVKKWVAFYKEHGCCLSMPIRGKLSDAAKKRNAKYMKDMKALEEETGGCFIEHSALKKAGLL